MAASSQQAQAPFDIQFDKASKFYYPGETVSGTIVVKEAKNYMDHQGISLCAESYMDTVSAIRGNMGRPPLKVEDRTVFMKKDVHLQRAGKVISSEPVKFEFVLEATGKDPLIDAYVGVEFSIVYKVTVTLTKAASKIVTGEAQFYCYVPGAGIDKATGRRRVTQNFLIKPELLEDATTKTMPKFEFRGNIGSLNCCFNEPFEGFLVCKQSELNMKSVEIQLVRVESFEGKTNATEVQNIQVADGDVIPDLEIPLHMLFPKIYSCATCQHQNFSIEFHVNLIVIFHNGYQLTENFPIRIYR